MTEQTKTRFPAPLYAAAGAGDLAYQQLRKLPAVVNELSDRAAASLRTANDTANSTAASLKSTANATDFDKLRETAAASAVAFAQAAQERAVAVTFLKVSSWNFVAQGIIFTCSSVFQGLGDTRPAADRQDLAAAARRPGGRE